MTYRVHQNPDKSNNFFKQIFNEELNITKNPFTWYLGIPGAQLFDKSPNDDLSLKCSHARCNVALSMLTNTASIMVLNDITLKCRCCL